MVKICWSDIIFRQCCEYGSRAVPLMQLAPRCRQCYARAYVCGARQATAVARLSGHGGRSCEPLRRSAVPPLSGQKVVRKLSSFIILSGTRGTHSPSTRARDSDIASNRCVKNWTISGVLPCARDGRSCPGRTGESNARKRTEWADLFCFHPAQTYHCLIWCWFGRPTHGPMCWRVFPGNNFMTTEPNSCRI